MSEAGKDRLQTTSPQAAAGAVVCPRCDVPVPPTQRFCGQCGASLVRVCESCGAENMPADQFCGSCGTRLSKPIDSDSRAKGEPPAAALPEERRWATMLFADLSDFTAISERMDPEDVKALAHRCAQRLSEEVRRFGGTVITVAGDQVVAAFGAPLAHEGDAERAGRAGLAQRDWRL